MRISDWSSDVCSSDLFNAPRSITRAAALYVLRTLIDDAIPMNDGCLRPVELVVPEGSMLNPKPGAAVVAGNVETSQVVTDALFAATGRLAPSQGRSEEHTSALPSLLRISYAFFSLKKKT